ncbi:MAG: 4Fe-4S ferredoxin, partial [Anaerolinea sp.]|nr:4Fe-4S ferredoxin [Anaerolinea sp.]
MKVLLFYFTGTGNSLLVAKKIAQRIQGAVIKPVMDLIEDVKNFDYSGFFDADAIGFVYPIYFDRSPEI